MVPQVLAIAFTGQTSELIFRTLHNAKFRVEVAPTLDQAIAALGARSYDIAILDADSSETAGAATARALRALSRRPLRVCAIGELSAKLERHAGEGAPYDAVLAKPFNHDALLATSRQLLAGAMRWQAYGHSLKIWRNCGLEDRPKIWLAAEPSASDLEAIDWCFDIAEPFEAEAIFAPRGALAADIESLRASHEAALLPVIDQSGDLSGADVVFRASEIETWRAVARTLTLRARERARLLRKYVRASRLEDRLLAGLFVSGEALRPARDPQRRECVSYSGFWREEDIAAHAPRMARQGLLESKFVDRMHACPSCRSRRLNVREECLKCASPALTETPIVHHYTCQYEGPETDFRRGAALICPKCLKQLRHYGSDYDKPGHILFCGACGGSNSEAAVGFSCLDCGAHAQGETCPTVDIFAYEITDAAMAKLTRGGAEAATEIELPKRVADQVAALAHREGAKAADFAIIEIGYAASSEPSSATLPIEGLRAMLRQNIADIVSDLGEIVEGDGADYLIVAQSGEEALEEFASGLLDHCQRPLAKGLKPAFRILNGARQNRAA